MSVGLAVGGAIVLMAGCATVLVGEARRLESARGWPSLTSLGTVLIGCGFALGVAFAAVTIAGLRGGGRRRAGRGPALAEADSLPGRGDYWPEPGPRTGMTLPGGWTGGSAGGSAAEVAGDSGAFGLDDRGAAEDWGGPGEASPSSRKRARTLQTYERLTPNRSAACAKVRSPHARTRSRRSCP